MKSTQVVEELFIEQKELMVKSLEKFECESLSSLASHLVHCKGIIVLTGVGKSAFVAQKVSRTLVSCGMRAVYLSPLDALHGDLGMVSSEDWVIFISKSGESDELIQIAPFLKERGVKMAAFVTFEKCRLASWMDIVVKTPVEGELGPLPMPTTSTLLQLFYADLLAVAVLKLRDTSIDAFTRNHPAGQIGKRLILRVDEFMITGDRIPKARKQDTISEVLTELSDKRCGCLLVVDENESLLGVFTDGDLRRNLQKHGTSCLDKKMEEVMTQTARHVQQGSLAHEALELMEANKANPITMMPVLKNGQVRGLIRLHDLIQAGI